MERLKKQTPEALREWGKAVDQRADRGRLRGIDRFKTRPKGERRLGGCLQPRSSCLGRRIREKKPGPHYYREIEATVMKRQAKNHGKVVL